ncbi:MAG TPA: tRNA (N(6)-L-threonylcarbamoyladenosine(37)-C(2))-methylthiotransferase MtaB [Anaerolineales bacterium]|nr:tRNA (N(6)-L-threonylcarbamoyladenosine(37)-C(2))-methylthiotransferase MtaB [Anaerolineales bacterium]
MKIFLDTIGCRLNQAEIESLGRQFRAAGHAIVATAGEADLAVVNTCTVTAEAASDSRAAVRRANRRGAGNVVVTGCWATLEPEKAAELPGVLRIVPNQRKDRLAADLLGLPQEFFDLEPLARQPLPGLHQRTRGFIKVQDGCDNACTFCITTVARGAGRSRPVEDVLADVNAALEGGTQEIVLTGVHLGSWGQDFKIPRHLGELVSALLIRTSAPRLRLSSLEPWDLDDEFFSLWKEPRLCRHLHLPLQSGSAGVLKRMRRKTSPQAFSRLVESARTIIPEVAITTDIIVGFPGETDEEFAETLEFVRAMQFSGGHVFTYSARPGTPASRMHNQVHGDVARMRSHALCAVLAESAGAYRRKFLGRTLSVLWESTDQFSDAGWRLEGWTDNYLRVTATSPEPRWNHLDAVQLTGVDHETMTGVILAGNS